MTQVNTLHPIFQEALAPFTRALPVWRSETDLMARLIAAQNALRTPIDIMSFAGMCDSRDELLAHVEHYEAAVADQAVQS